MWAKAKELRPNKPITTLLVTHHHGDHTAGVRDAVALGVTQIIAHESNLAYLNDLLSGPTRSTRTCSPSSRIRSR